MTEQKIIAGRSAETVADWADVIADSLGWPLSDWRVAQALRDERERCAGIVDQVAKPDDNTALGEAAASVYNDAADMHLPVSERLAAWNAVIATAIRGAE